MFPASIFRCYIPLLLSEGEKCEDGYPEVSQCLEDIPRSPPPPPWSSKSSPNDVWSWESEMYNKIKKIKNGFGQNYDVESCDLRQERPTYESPQNTRWRRIGVFWTSEGRLASPKARHHTLIKGYYRSLKSGSPRGGRGGEIHLIEWRNGVGIRNVDLGFYFKCDRRESTALAKTGCTT